VPVWNCPRNVGNFRCRRPTHDRSRPGAAVRTSWKRTVTDQFGPGSTASSGVPALYDISPPVSGPMRTLKKVGSRSLAANSLIRRVWLLLTTVYRRKSASARSLAIVPNVREAPGQIRVVDCRARQETPIYFFKTDVLAVHLRLPDRGAFGSFTITRTVSALPGVMVTVDAVPALAPV